MGFAVAFGTKGSECSGPGCFGGGQGYFFGSCLDGFKEGGGPPSADDEASCADFGLRYDFWFFQFAFAATAATIVSGAVAERTSTLCYVVYSIILTAAVYPVVVHWQWGGGFTSVNGAVDYAGSGVVHMTGGLSAIYGAAIIGPRRGRFSGKCCRTLTNEMPQHSIVFSTIGTMLLWWGWYGFNVGSTLGITWVYESSGAGASEAGLVLINTTLAPSAAGLTAMVIKMVSSRISEKKMVMSVSDTLNGILAGQGQS